VSSISTAGEGNEIEACPRENIVATSVSIIIIIFYIFTSNNTPTNKRLISGNTTFYLKLLLYFVLVDNLKLN
jgi:hypothetical protein